LHRTCKHKALRLLKYTLGTAIVGLSLYYLGTNIVRGMAELKTFQWQLSWLDILISFALTFVCVILGGVVWNLVLRSLGHDLGLRVSTRAHLQANVAKYVPGFAWQIVGKAYLTRRLGVPTQIVGVAIGLEFGLLALTGVFLAALLLPASYLKLDWMPSYAPALRSLVALIMALIIVGLPRLSQAWTTYARRRKWSQWEMEVQPRAIWSASSLLIAAWLLLGLAFHLLVTAVYPAGWQALPISAFALIVSFLISLAVIFIPNGIGIREGLMAYLMGAIVPPGPAITKARTSNIRTLLLICSLLFLIYSKTTLSARLAAANRYLATWRYHYHTR